jgi:hypothetical protein
MTLINVLFLSAFMVNISITFFFLYALLARYTAVFVIAHSIYPSFYDKLVAAKLIVEMCVRQWLQKNIVKFNEFEYELTHVIDGELVRIRLKRVVPRIVEVQDCETEESLPQALSYALFRQVPWPNQRLIYYYEDGTSNEDGTRFLTIPNLSNS